MALGILLGLAHVEQQVLLGRARLELLAGIGSGAGVALANFAGVTGGLEAAGRSGVWAPGGEELVRLGPTGAGVAVASCSRGAAFASVRALTS